MADYPPAGQTGASAPEPGEAGAGATVSREPGAGQPAGVEPAGGEPGDGPVAASEPAAAQAEADLRHLREAIELSRRSPPSVSAFSVGAVLVGSDGQVISTGYSRELDPKDHAEEVALRRAAGDPRLLGATLYSSLEPCRARASRSRTCAELILGAGVRRVVIAWLEPPLFTDGAGAAALRRAGITVTEIPRLAALARSVNAHLLPG
jgi:diaminohydroxyphosphoribosylaminopyrimidine deaminase / 5-amino-6-(5-phosphoribosylamino)uracil reductase